MRLHKLAATTAAIALFAASAASVQATPTGPLVCPGGWGYWTLADGLIRYAGYYTVEVITAHFNFVDANGNGIICNNPFPDKFYPLQHLADDKPTGTGH